MTAKRRETREGPSFMDQAIDIIQAVVLVTWLAAVGAVLWAVVPELIKAGIMHAGQRGTVQ
jgi:hypothetical protein